VIESTAPTWVRKCNEAHCLGAAVAKGHYADRHSEGRLCRLRRTERELCTNRLGFRAVAEKVRADDATDSAFDLAH
jgi:hypothetical protein